MTPPLRSSQTAKELSRVGSKGDPDKLSQEFGSVQEDAAVADLEKQNLATSDGGGRDRDENWCQRETIGTRDAQISPARPRTRYAKIQSVRVEQSGDIDKKFTPEVLASISERPSLPKLRRRRR